MVFVNKESGKGGETLPGSGLEIDLDRRVCPECGRESPPWEERCRDCGVVTVRPEEAPAADFHLPGLDDDEDLGDAGRPGRDEAGRDEAGRDEEE